MKKTLVVMRHGKAARPSQGQRDEDRELTQAGADALAGYLPHMLRLLETKDASAQIWTSPAKRARQTAKLLEKALKEKGVLLEGKVEPHDSLWRQNVDAFLDELRASEAELVFAVGHIPFAEEVVEELVGATPPFSTGALGCIEVHFAEGTSDGSSPTQDDCRLQWFVQGPVAADWNTFIQLQEALTARAEAIEERREAFFAHPEDIETIHRFRTNIRALRSLVAFIKPWQNAQQNAETQAILKEVVRYTSRLRELDVLEKNVRANPDVSPKLLAFCREEAAEERKKVHKVLASKQVASSFERAMSSAKGIVWKKRHVRRGLPQGVVRARFDALIEAVGAEIDNVDLTHAEHTHDVRKRAKRARYVAEYAYDAVGSDAVDITKAMTAHQDTLGDVCDARANIRLLSEFLQRDLPKPVAKELAQMKEENEALLKSLLKAHEK